MLITEGVDYEYNKELYRAHNWVRDFPVRIFTYQIGDDTQDAKELEWIACANMGKISMLLYACVINEGERFHEC